MRLLDRQNKPLEQQIVEAADKAGILDKIIEMVEEDYNIPIRKNGYPGSRTLLQRERKADKHSLLIGRDKQTEVLLGKLADSK